MTLTPEERAMLRLWHRKCEYTDCHDDFDHCIDPACDGQPWPCRTVRFCDALDVAEAHAAALTDLLHQAHDKMDDVNAKNGRKGLLCHWCGAHKYDGTAVGVVHERGCIILTLRAALKGARA